MKERNKQVEKTFELIVDLLAFNGVIEFRIPIFLHLSLVGPANFQQENTGIAINYRRKVLSDARNCYTVISFKFYDIFSLYYLIFF